MANNSVVLDINEKFNRKIEDLKKTLPGLKVGVNCCALTLTNILDVIGIKNNIFFNNLAIPLAGGFGGFKSKDGWHGACGAVNGGVGAIGIIMGGKKEKMSPERIMAAYMKAVKYCSQFEKKFGSVVCKDLCGYDFSDIKEYIKYQKNNIWEKVCCKLVIGAVDMVREFTKEDLKEKWE
ncbi:MAG: C-GCAxxG-C-C family protein [Promethearchaeota archaeon]